MCKGNLNLLESSVVLLNLVYTYPWGFVAFYRDIANEWWYMDGERHKRFGQKRSTEPHESYNEAQRKDEDKEKRRRLGTHYTSKYWSFLWYSLQSLYIRFSIKGIQKWYCTLDCQVSVSTDQWSSTLQKGTYPVGALAMANTAPKHTFWLEALADLPR